MTFGTSYLPIATLRDALKNAIALNIAGTSPDTLKAALFTNTITTSPDTDPQTYGVAPWNANEVSGTGYTAGGPSLTTVTNTLVSGVGIMVDCDDISITSSTITSAQGMLVYDNTLSPKCGIVAVNFGGAFSTVAGTFAVAIDANGLYRIDTTP